MKKLFPEKAQVGTVKRAYLVKRQVHTTAVMPEDEKCGGTSIN